jgi:CRP-like cAMP-binding protein
LGPDAIVGERSILETGRATATVTAITCVRAAEIPVDAFGTSDLAAVAAGHNRENGR